MLLRLATSLALAVMVATLWASGPAAAQVGGDPVLVGAGDIGSCRSEGDEATADLIAGIEGTVATFGDNAYPRGRAADFARCYDPSWGPFKDRTKPSPGNHEYETAGASGYFDYFGITAGDPGKGYYAYDLGSWRVISLNSNCSSLVGGCGPGSPQEQWLKAELAAHSNACTLAYWHHPRFSSKLSSGGNSNMKPFWEALYAAKADVVLNGHIHNYERFAPQTPSGVEDDPARGIREFVVGTGGYSLNTFQSTQQAPNSEKQYADSYGVLKLTLHPTSYDWKFVAADGTTPDSGSDYRCEADGMTTDSVPPTVISTSPANNTSGIDQTANVTATFSEEMKASSIITPATTFKLVKLNSDGTTTKVMANVRYDAATKKAILDPASNLSSGRTYKATVTTGAQDLAGNALDQKPTIAGNQSKSWKFTVQ